jgi:tetratricopeptide (TPR) repeat protein
MAAGDPIALARHYLQLRRFDRGLDALDRVSSTELDNVEMWRIRAACLHGLRRYDEAVDAAERGLAGRPDDMGLLDQVALSAFEAGKRRRAHAALRRALALAPRNPVLIAHQALFLARTKGLSRRFRAGKARATGDLALSLAPDSLQVLRIRTAVAALTRDPRADAFKQQLLALDPADKSVRMTSGAVDVRSRRIDEGLRHYVEAARLDPGDERAVWLGRRSRALLHPAAKPLRLLWRVGAGRVQIAVIVVSSALLLLHASTVRTILLVLWFLLVLYVVAIRIGLRLRFGRKPR